ncbi:MAG: hypothetical protein HQL76_18165, partial [Magnetococcales bacterium]|nr:hypothetical protein [Magnetococcales bacterium]
MAEINDTTMSSDQKTLDATISDVAATTTGALGDSRGLELGAPAPDETQADPAIEGGTAQESGSSGTPQSAPSTSETETLAVAGTMEGEGIGVLSGFDPTFGMGVTEEEVAVEESATDPSAPDAAGVTSEGAGVGVLSGFDPTFGLGVEGEASETGISETAVDEASDTTMDATAETVAEEGVPSIFDPTFGAGEETPAEEPTVTATQGGDGGVPSIFDPTFGAGEETPAEETPAEEPAGPATHGGDGGVPSMCD